MTKYDVGTVYLNRKYQRYYLAITPDTVITYCNGKMRRRKSLPKGTIFYPFHSVGDLVESWGITLEEFDRVMAQWHSPEANGIVAHPSERGKRSRMQRDAVAELFMAIRRVRIMGNCNQL